VNLRGRAFHRGSRIVTARRSSRPATLLLGTERWGSV
jgi:hypothetical protein